MKSLKTKIIQSRLYSHLMIDLLSANVKLTICDNYFDKLQCSTFKELTDHISYNEK